MIAATGAAAPRAVMKHETITLLYATSTDDPSASRWRAVVERWPMRPAPEATPLLIGHALREPNLLSGDVIVVSPGVDTPAADVYKLLDRLESRRRPAVIIPEEGDDRFNALASDSVFIFRQPDEPALLAGLLHALFVRQSAVDSLLGELRVARRFQGGLCDEIDRMHEELQLAANVQQQLLPAELPTLDAVEFGVLFRPCGYVSGDIYDLKQLDDHHVGFFLADAVGHGVPAALLTMVLRRGLSMLEIRDGAAAMIPPARALTGLNDAMLRTQGGNARFATAVYGVVDNRDMRVTMAAAGHPPPLRIRSDGRATPVETDGCLLGVFPDAEFRQVEFTLGADELLLIYSDGFETAFPEGFNPTDAKRPTANRRYLDHFAKLFHHRRAEGLSGALDRLSRQIDRQHGSLHQVDDLSALAIAGVESENRVENDAASALAGAAGA